MPDSRIYEYSHYEPIICKFLTLFGSCTSWSLFRWCYTNVHAYCTCVCTVHHAYPDYSNLCSRLRASSTCVLYVCILCVCTYVRAYVCTYTQSGNKFSIGNCYELVCYWTVKTITFVTHSGFFRVGLSFLSLFCECKCTLRLCLF